MHKSIGRTLKTLRQDRNLKLKDVAKALNVDPSTISKYENNTRSVSPEMIKAFSDFYQVDANHLLQTEYKDHVKPLSFHVPKPLIKPLSKFKIGLFFLYIISLLLLVATFSLFNASETLKIIVSFTALLILILLIGSNLAPLFIKKNQPYEIYTVYPHETLYLKHPYEEDSIRKVKRNDFISNSIMILTTLFLVGFYGIFIKELWLLNLFILMGFVHCIFLVIMNVMILMNQTERKIIYYSKTNTYINTLKYRLYLISSFIMTTFFILSLGDVINQTSGFEPWIPVLLVTNFVIYTYSLIYSKHQFYKLYTIEKN